MRIKSLLGKISGAIRYYLLKAEKKIWQKFSIFLPLWRHEVECDAILLQDELDRQHALRDEYDEYYGENLTTRMALKARQIIFRRGQRHPLINGVRKYRQKAYSYYNTFEKTVK